MSSPTSSPASPSKPPINPAQVALVEALSPLLQRIAELQPQSADSPEAVQKLQDTLEADFPYEGETVQGIKKMLAQGVQDGWACNRGPESARFSRLAKPSPQTHNLSIDAVDMEGAAIEHTHPQGEISLAFPAPGASEPSCRFDQHPPGWVFLGPNSRHIPTVKGGRMQIIYFLPAGEVIWHQ